MEKVVEGWLEIVRKVRGEVEKGRFSGSGGWSSYGILSQKLGIIGQASTYKKTGILHPPPSTAPPSSSLSPSREPMTFPRRPMTPKTIDVILQRTLMLEMTTGESKNVLLHKFYANVVKSDVGSYKFHQEDAEFGKFWLWTKDNYEFQLGEEVLKIIWDETEAKDPQEQDIGWEADDEIEKGLHWLENVPPYVLFNQLLSQSFYNSYYALEMFSPSIFTSGGRGTRVLEELKSQIFKTCSLLHTEIIEGECVTEIREDNLIDQEILQQCDLTCRYIEEVELYAVRCRTLEVKTGVVDGCDFDFENFKCRGDGGEKVIEDYQQTLEFIKYYSDGKPKKVTFCEVGEKARRWGKYEGGEWTLTSCIRREESEE
ncbi:hypothetical protein TrVE_jg222 [Triparma verrucosa]|uniref:Uncharacterized protein n=1 Tax=Triparma verrucosa TaxID=1606542 RepID=A0A9W7C2X3_9STRA|nr:hypothetical protein TrVE_jg222 [Triparma verrucosa]